MIADPSLITLDTDAHHQKKIKQAAEKVEVARSAGLVPGLDLEGIVAKRLADAYDPRRTRWWKTLNRDYSQKAGRAELFERRYG